MTADATRPARRPHEGMPPLDLSGPALSFYEFWKPRYFYAPIFVYWTWLFLRHRGMAITVANPLFPMGGLVNESKRDILDTVKPEGRAVLAQYTSYTRGEAPGDARAEAGVAAARIRDAGLKYPVVAKPNIGCRGVGVRVIRSDADLEAYLGAYPSGYTMLLQELADFEGEAGVFYIREQHEPRGRIFSLTLKYFPYVTGDGRSTLRDLIVNDARAGQIAHVYLPRHARRLDEVLPSGQPFRLAFAGSHSRGTIFRDGAAFITPALEDRFEQIARTIPEFYFGRFDVRFSSLPELEQGRNFKIVEINGAGAEATHVWDSKTPILKAYATLMRQYAIAWRIGARNRKRGFKQTGLWEFWRAYRDETKLWTLYPLND